MTAMPLDVADPVASLARADASVRSELEAGANRNALDYVAENDPAGLVAFAAQLVYSLDEPVMGPGAFHGARA